MLNFYLSFYCNLTRLKFNFKYKIKLIILVKLIFQLLKVTNIIND